MLIVLCIVAVMMQKIQPKIIQKSNPKSLRNWNFGVSGWSPGGSWSPQGGQTFQRPKNVNLGGPWGALRDPTWGIILGPKLGSWSKFWPSFLRLFFSTCSKSCFCKFWTPKYSKMRSLSRLKNKLPRMAQNCENRALACTESTFWKIWGSRNARFLF